MNKKVLFAFIAFSIIIIVAGLVFGGDISAPLQTTTGSPSRETANDAGGLRGLFSDIPFFQDDPEDDSITPSGSDDSGTDTNSDTSTGYKSVAEVVPSDTHLEGKIIGSDGDVKFIDKERHEAYYIASQDMITLSIIASPFDFSRLQAEQDLLQTLQISQQEACTMNVAITTPSFVNPENAGVIYRLSFCE